MRPAVKGKSILRQNFCLPADHSLVYTACAGRISAAMINRMEAMTGVDIDGDGDVNDDPPEFTKTHKFHRRRDRCRASRR